MSDLKRLTGLIAGVLLISGCDAPSRSVGDEGKAEFRYRFTSIVDCAHLARSVDPPLVAGGAEPVCILAKGGAPLEGNITVESSDPHVFSVTPGALDGQSVLSDGAAEPGLIVTLHGGEPGEAELVLNKSGVPFDRITIRVAKAARISLDLNGIAQPKQSDVDAVILRYPNVELPLNPHVFADNGEELAAYHSIHASTGDLTVASVAEDQALDDSFEQNIDASANGDTTLTLTVGGFQHTWPVGVRDWPESP